MTNAYSLPDEQFGKIIQDSLFVEERRSRGYIALMERIQVALDQCEPEDTGIDLRDIESRRGCLVYFETDRSSLEIPYDIEYIPKLSHSLRKQLLERLEDIRPRLTMRHRRLLRHMRFLHNWEHITGITRYDVARRVEATLEEIERYKSMANVAFGSNKLCILRDALLLPARTHFELVSTRQALRDTLHPGHEEAVKWLKSSSFHGKLADLERFVHKAFKQLSNACDHIYDQIESITGISFSRDFGHQDADRAWYNLGAVVERDGDPGNDFDLHEVLKKQSFENIKRGWSPDFFEDRRKKIEAISKDTREKAAGLTRLFYELRAKIVEAPKPDGTVQLTIASDRKLGLLNEDEYEEARNWVIENQTRLASMFETVFDELGRLEKDDPKLALAEEIEQCFNRVRSDNFRNQKALQRELEHRLKELCLDDIKEEVEDFDLEDTVADSDEIRTLLGLYEAVNRKAESVSIGDVALLRRFRLAWNKWEDCEERLSKLYRINDDLERVRIRLERLIFNGYKKMSSWLALPEEDLDRCLAIVIRHMYTSLRVGEYRDIDIQGLQRLFKTALKQEPGEALLRLDYLLQEVQAIPDVAWLTGALESWQGQSGPEEIKKRSAFLMENEELRKAFEARIRGELKKRLGTTDRESRRVRFEVFGLGSCLQDTLAKRLEILTTQLPKLASIEDADTFARDISALEDRILEAQKISQPGKDTSRRIIEMEHKGEIDHQMAGKLHQDLEENYAALEEIMATAGEAVRLARKHQIRFGREQDLEYLGLTLQVDDIEALRKQYGFLDNVSLEDMKKYCLAHRVVTDFMDNLMARAHHEGKSIHPEILDHFTRKSYKNYFGKGREGRRRAVSRRLKVAILRHNQAILEAEARRLMLWLNFADPRILSEQDTYRNFSKLFDLAEQRDDKMNRWLNHIWERLRSSLMTASPEGFQSNFEHNRTAFISEINAACQGQGWI